MAIKIKMNDGNYSLFQKLGVDKLLLNEMRAHDIHVEMVGFKVSFFDGETLLASSLLAASSESIMSPADLPNAVVEVLRGSVENTINAILMQSQFKIVKAIAEKTAEDIDIAGVVAQQTAKKLDADLLADAFGSVAMKYVETVPLKDATSLYQPVEGTTKGSRYYVVAMSSQIKIAARVQDDTVSLRAEGNISDVDAMLLMASGFDAKGGYYSAHFNLGGSTTASRLVGAVLAGTNLEFHTPLPVVDKLTEVAA